MIKKISLVLTALLSGLFLANCSDSSTDDPEPLPSPSLQVDVSSSSSEDAPSSSSDDTPLSSSLQVDVSSSSLDDAPLSSSLQVDVSSSSSDSTPSSSSLQVEASLRAEPVAAAPDNSVDVLYSWTYENENYYIINAGYIKNSLLMENGFHYSGVGYMGITATEMTETSIAENRTNTVSNSIVVSTGSTNTTTETKGLKEAITTGVTTGVEVGGKTKGIVAALFVKGSVKASIETTIEGSVEKSTETSSQISKSFETSTGRTTEVSNSFETTLKQSFAKSTSLAANSGDPAGYYRYAWYAVSDVYFIISTSLDNQELTSWEVASIPREKYELHQEYSPEKFDNSPIAGTEIVFAEDFYKKLKIPTTEIQTYTLTANASEGGSVSRNPNQITYEAGTLVTVTATPKAGYIFNGWAGVPSGVNASNDSITFAINSNLALTANFRRVIEKKEIKEFTASDTFTFNKSFPATVEIYALGPGGGGQGGHRMDAGLGRHYSGSGAAGGGGAAVYYKTTINSSSNFKIDVGKGGKGGDGFRESGVGSWNSGYPGTDGGSTSVTWNNGNSSIIANGGKLGGGGDRYQGLNAGSGGKASICEGCTSVDGEDGTVGERGYSVDASKLASKGGNSGTVHIEGSSVNPFGNGLGAERQNSDVITRYAGYGGGGFGGYHHTQSGSDGGNGKVVLVFTYYE